MDPKSGGGQMIVRLPLSKKWGGPSPPSPPLVTPMLTIIVDWHIFACMSTRIASYSFQNRCRYVLIWWIIIIRLIHNAFWSLANSHRKSCLIYVNSNFVLQKLMYILILFLHSENVEIHTMSKLKSYLPDFSMIHFVRKFNSI